MHTWILLVIQKETLIPSDESNNVRNLSDYKTCPTLRGVITRLAVADLAL